VFDPQKRHSLLLRHLLLLSLGLNVTCVCFSLRQLRVREEFSFLRTVKLFGVCTIAPTATSSVN
jgi:hypothetical protein